MKISQRSILAVLVTGLLFFTLTVFAQASSPISIIVDGNATASDVPPQIINGSTMVPVRVISEALGATVSWDNASKTVTLLKNGVHIAMTLGGYTLMNASPITLDNPAQLINGRVMVPIRFIATAFGCQVNWNAANQEVDISSNSAGSQTSSSGVTTTPDSSTQQQAPTSNSGGTTLQETPTTDNSAIEAEKHTLTKHI